jgi:hypothetical protein
LIASPFSFFLLTSPLRLPSSLFPAHREVRTRLEVRRLGDLSPRI